MFDPDNEDYPAEAFAEEGRTGRQALWWELKVTPGKPNLLFGAEQKLAAWMAFNLDLGEHFTIRMLREALGSEVVPNDQEHLNRRFRELRKDGWEFPSNKDDRSLPSATYRLDAKGWNPALGARPPRNVVSERTRRQVLDRDGWRCVICGIGPNEPYPDGFGTAYLTVGHIRSREAGGSSQDLNNLRTECKRCNEPVRNEMRVPQTPEELLPSVRNLTRPELERLLAWLEQGYRGRDRLDDLYDRARMMGFDDREHLKAKVRRTLGLPAAMN
ncbi:HNH endonuclease [Actinoplanes sp. NPDC049599]|uniref:HNH endonuclease n=1 Tax=Actinoplanes sp. NPDC049599 TaxID=3363903 RepID=UPI0037B726E6